MTTGQISMNSMPDVMQLIAPEPALMVAGTSVTLQSDKGSSDGFSTIISEKITALEAEKQSATIETEPVEVTVSATEQQIMIAFAAAAQMNVTPLPTSTKPETANEVRQENDFAQNVPVIAAATLQPPVAHQQQSGRTPDEMKRSNQATATEQNVQTSVPAENTTSVTALVQTSGLAQETTIGRTPEVSAQPKFVTTTVANNQKDQVPLSTGLAVATTDKATRSESVPAIAPLSGTVARQIMQAAYQAEIHSVRASEKLASEQNVPTTPIAPPAEESVIPAVATTPESSSVIGALKTETLQTGQQTGRTYSEQQQNGVRMPEVLDLHNSDSAAQQNILKEQIDPVQISTTPIAPESMPATTVTPNAASTRVLPRSEPAKDTPQQAVSMAPANPSTPAAETAHAQPALQQLQTDTGARTETAKSTHTEEGKKELSHSETAALATDSLIAKQPSAPIELSAVAVAEQVELPASAATDARSTLGQRALRGSAVQHDTKSVVENVPPRTQQTASVKEMTAAQQNIVTTGETTTSDSSLGREGEQTGNHPQSGNQIIVPAFSVQQKTDHPLATTAKVSAEPAQQGLPEQIAGQVRDRLTQHELKPGQQQISLTLSPENLGEVKMNLSLQGQRLTVEIVTDNRIARDAIMQHADTLKETLARQNITMESFDVTTGGKGSGTPGQNQNAWQELAKKQQQQQLWSSPRGYNTAQADLPSGAAAYQSNKGRSMLDIHY